MLRGALLVSLIGLAACARLGIPGPAFPGSGNRGTAELVESPPESGNIELLLRVQGVGPGQPRTIVVPYGILLQDDSLDPDAVGRRAFDAEVVSEGGDRWVVERIDFASRVLRPPG